MKAGFALKCSQNRPYVHKITVQQRTLRADRDAVDFYVFQLYLPILANYFPDVQYSIGNFTNMAVLTNSIGAPNETEVALVK